MASNNRVIVCGPRMTLVAMGLKFLVGPAIMAVASIVIGLRDRMLKVAIIQVIISFFFVLFFRNKFPILLVWYLLLFDS